MGPLGEKGALHLLHLSSLDRKEEKRDLRNYSSLDGKKRKGGEMVKFRKLLLERETAFSSKKKKGGKKNENNRKATFLLNNRERKRKGRLGHRPLQPRSIFWNRGKEGGELRRPAASTEGRRRGESYAHPSAKRKKSAADVLKKEKRRERQGRPFLIQRKGGRGATLAVLASGAKGRKGEGQSRKRKAHRRLMIRPRSSREKCLFWKKKIVWVLEKGKEGIESNDRKAATSRSLSADREKKKSWSNLSDKGGRGGGGEIRGRKMLVFPLEAIGRGGRCPSERRGKRNNARCISPLRPRGKRRNRYQEEQGEKCPLSFGQGTGKKKRGKKEETRS